MRRRRHFNFILISAGLVLVIWMILFTQMAETVSRSSTQDQRTALRQALNHAITDCYALEGMYPPDLDYMKDHYGLTYDEDLFFVDYKPVASNIRPDFFIITRAAGRHTGAAEAHS